MREIDICLVCLAKVRSALTDDEMAYVARSRIGRLTLAVGALVARICGVQLLDRPDRLKVPSDAPKDILVLVERCNELLDTSRPLAVPSEPLSERWISWKLELTEQLDSLEDHVRAMRSDLALAKDQSF